LREFSRLARRKDSLRQQGWIEERARSQEHQARGESGLHTISPFRRVFAARRVPMNRAVGSSLGDMPLRP
jgi:hypothetical protein